MAVGENGWMMQGGTCLGHVMRCQCPREDKAVVNPSQRHLLYLHAQY